MKMKMKMPNTINPRMMVFRFKSCQFWLFCVLSWTLSRVIISNKIDPASHGLSSYFGPTYKINVPNMDDILRRMPPPHRLLYAEEFKQTALPRNQDVFIFSAFKYYKNFIEFHDKLHNVWKPQAEFIIDQDVFRLLGQRCFTADDTELELFENYIAGYTTPNDLLQKDNATLEDSCVIRGIVPTLRCVLNDKSQRHECTCAVEDLQSKSTTFVYEEQSQSTLGGDTRRVCIGRDGVVCDGVNITCIDGYGCDEGYCGGLQSAQGRIMGASTSFTDRDIRNLFLKRQFKTLQEAELWLIRTSYFQDIIGKSCNFRYWAWATDSLSQLLFSVDNVEEFREFISVNYQESLIKFLTTDLYIYFISSVLKDMHFFDQAFPVHIPFLVSLAQSFEPAQGHYIQLANSYYDDGTNCLNEFPRMQCVQSPIDINRGRCSCSSNISNLFDYYEEDGQCVGKEGVVCTTVRGSGDQNCAKGLKCEFVQDIPTTGIPSALSHLEIKVCKNLSNRRTNATSTNEAGNTTETKNCRSHTLRNLSYSHTITFLIFTFFKNLE